MGTTTIRIAPGAWLTYFNDVGITHAGWTTTIEVLRDDLGDQRIADGLPLQEMSFEPRGSEAVSILIELGDTPDEFMIHHVRDPARVSAVETPGTELAIQIESRDRTATLVTLRRPPELPGGSR